MESCYILNDWMTAPETPLYTKLIDDAQDKVYHSHQFYEIFYILEGTVEHRLNDTVETLKPGDVFFLNLRDAHIFLREEGNRCKHRDIVLRREFFEDTLDFLGAQLSADYRSDRLPKHIALPLSAIEDYEQRLRQLTLPAGAPSAYRLTGIRTLTVSLLEQLLHTETELNRPRYPAWLEDLLTRLNDPAVMKAGLCDTLAAYHFDRAYMCRCFKQHLGCTMTEYVNDRRLEQEALRLQYADGSILSVSEEVGFSSVSYFNTIFKKKYGVSPKQFRRKQKTLEPPQQP